ncbi:MAG TPA: beta-L-arabinofuranosidase domain-containing protein [Candidatus Limnocylindria bacterium]|nr:beta-L-arabinofuranosidase domain-containing protein [Candidatus Limnocylindria bacterium]
MDARRGGCFGEVVSATHDGGFFGPVVRGVRGVMLPAQWEALNDRVPGGAPSRCIRNFRAAAGLEQAGHEGFCFQDSDLYKWLEAAAYQLCLGPDPGLEALADGAVALIAQAQAEDGYLDTYYQLNDIGKRWTNLKDDHELYVAGHLMEAAVAYYQATGKDALLDVAQRCARHIISVLGPEEGKKRGVPGHPEIELALCRLYDATGREEYLRLAAFFIHERGRSPNWFVLEQARLGRAYDGGGTYGFTYAQHHRPLQEQETLEGHAVRALYLLCGAADVALRTGDAALMGAVKRLFRNAAQRRMYVTGGVGSSHLGEAFTLDYDLPSDTAYAETCASVALVMLCRRLLEDAVSGEYADVMERALYNACLAGMSLDMTRFFYVNPLACDPAASRLDGRKKHVLPTRPAWFGCACCPPNLARLLSSLARYAVSAKDDAVAVHLYVQGEYAVRVGGAEVALTLRTEYPRDGAVRLALGRGAYDVLLRVPGWCKSYTLERDGQAVQAPPRDGYARLAGPFDGTEVTLRLDMPPRRAYMNARAAEEAGRVALMRGPLVFCLEERDNGPALHQLILPRDAAIAYEDAPGLPGGMALKAKGLRERPAGEALYPDAPGERAEADLAFIPYYAWANRGENEMRVWVRE